MINYIETHLNKFINNQMLHWYRINNMSHMAGYEIVLQYNDRYIVTNFTHEYIQKSPHQVIKILENTINNRLSSKLYRLFYGIPICAKQK